MSQLENKSTPPNFFFIFFAIAASCSPQIRKLELLWHHLISNTPYACKQNHTNSIIKDSSTPAQSFDLLHALKAFLLKDW
jgi:hypothetical protein